jgi:hypothetical protein
VSAPPGPPQGRPRIPRVKSRPLPPAWTGITGPYCWKCAWSWHDGVREIKYVAGDCGVHVAMAAAGPEGGEGP